MAQVDFEKIRRELARRGSTKAWLARELKVANSTVYRWFSGDTKPDGATIFDIAKLLNMKPEDLIAS